jgi:hypothetical protein
MISRRFLQFRLRTCFLVLSAAAVSFAIWTNGANRQRRAVAAIGQLGQVVYYHEFPSADAMGTVDYTASPPGPTWLRRIVGDDYFQTVRIIDFAPTDNTMKFLSDLPRVDSVAIDAHRGGKRCQEPFSGKAV